MGRFATGVTVISTDLRGEAYGMTANAFMSGSLEPPLCVVSIRKEARMHRYLREARTFGVSFLAEDQRSISQHFSGRLGEGAAPPFEYFEGVPVVADALAHVVASVVDEAECGDHTLFIGRISHLAAADDGAPLVFYAGNYRRLDGSRD